MAEVGLLAFARCALDMAQQTMLSYWSKHSRHVFTQLHLLATVCWMRYENWTFREIESRVQEHSDLPRVLCSERTQVQNTPLPAEDIAKTILALREDLRIPYIVTVRAPRRFPETDGCTIT